jgi:L-serine dehydratase
MAISTLDIFKIGIGPSSSHTVGPMVAARRFAELIGDGSVVHPPRIRVELFGSLGATGKGHGTDKAVILGLMGLAPETVDVDRIPAMLDEVRAARRLRLPNGIAIAFDPAQDLRFVRNRALPVHPNAMRFQASWASGEENVIRTYYSVGGGFVVDGADHPGAGPITAPSLKPDPAEMAFPFRTAGQLLALCRGHGASIGFLMWGNECAWRPREQTRRRLLAIWKVMQECVGRGCRTEGVLPGGLKVPRRAPGIHRSIQGQESRHDDLIVIDWVNLYALAVNEENAAGGRVVTAPTNGAAGIIPAVLHYYTRFCKGADDDGVCEFLLTAAAIAILYKENASLSGAEMGCQGEVGVACSMAAGALAAVLGGTPPQVENAAEIAMEHHLGLTCDPVGGLVQIPCIERNAIASVKAINAARMALRGDGNHKVSLDAVIKTMRETGEDMKAKYKETARGGLALNVVEC